MTIALAITLCFPLPGFGQAAGPQAIHGNVSVLQDGNRTVVTTQNGAGSNHSAINWQAFGVAAGASTWFAQPGATSTSVNRVTGRDPSLILGKLGSNGRLVLVNPSGIAVGGAAAVDTAGFTASTLAMSQSDAIAGRMRFGADSGTAIGRLSVDGRIRAQDGDVVLLAPVLEVGRKSVIQSSRGDTILLAGQKAELTGRGLEGIVLEIKAPTDSVVNLGRLQGDSVGIFAGQLRHSGAIQARSANAAGGRVVLQGGVASEVAGRIDAVAADRGGSVHITAARVALKSSTTIDVGGPRGGGELLVGGGWQGRDSRIGNAQAVDVDAGVQLRADAQLSGAGGTVVVWSDQRTRFAGAISARGASGGDGGNAEVSGKQQLRFRGRADLGSDGGRTGRLLLDPAIVTIQGGSGDGSDAPDFSSGSWSGGLLAADGPSPYTIYQSELEGTNADISIQASQQIQVGGTFTGGALTVPANRDLRLEVTAGPAGGIDLRGMPIRSQGGKVELATTSAGQEIFLDSITTAGNGSIRIDAANARVNLGWVALQSGSGDIEISAGPAMGPGISLNGGSLQALAGSIKLRSPRGISVGGTTLQAAGAIELDATGNGVDFSGFNDLTQKVKVDADRFSVTGELRLSGSGQLDMGNVPLTVLATGRLTLAGGDVKASALDNWAGGTVGGDGKIDLGSGRLTNDGTLQPGDSFSVGTLRIKGDVTNSAGSRVFMKVAGRTSHDVLDVDGNLQLGGTLEVAALSYAPTPSDSYRLLKSKDNSGTFAAVDAPAFAGFAPVYRSREMDFELAAAPAAAPAPTPAPSPSPSPAPTPAPAPSQAPASATSPSVETGAPPAVAEGPAPPSPAAPAPAPSAPAGAPAQAPAGAPASATAPAPAPATAPAAAAAAPHASPMADPVAIAAVQQQASQLAAFLSRPPLAAATAASPRDKDDEAAMSPTQCLAIGGGTGR